MYLIKSSFGLKGLRNAPNLAIIVIRKELICLAISNETSATLIHPLSLY